MDSDHAQYSPVVDPNGAFLIAIGDDLTRLLYGPRAHPMPDLLFGLGSEIVLFDAQAQQPLGVSATYQPIRWSANGSDVNAFIFGGTQPAREVSAIIYSNSAIFSQPVESFDDLVLIHNPAARTPIPEGFLRFGEEWSRRGNRIEMVLRAR